MTTAHSFRLRGSWSGDKHSVGHIESDTLTTSVSIPSELGGPGVGSNPEHLLLGASSTCYLITLAAILTNREIPYLRIDLETTMVILDDHGQRVDSILHEPTIVVESRTDEQRLLTLADHAEHACMVSSALRGNVTMKVIARVVVEANTTTTPTA